MNSIVMATSSYNLSSIAVEPTSSKSCSISPSTSATFSSLSTKLNLATCDLFFQSSYTSGYNVLVARNRVLKPCSANASTYFWVSRYVELNLDYWLSKSYMIESAPLHINTISPSGFLKMQLILFLVLLVYVLYHSGVFVITVVAAS